MNPVKHERRIQMKSRGQRKTFPSSHCPALDQNLGSFACFSNRKTYCVSDISEIMVEAVFTNVVNSTL